MLLDPIEISKRIRAKKKKMMEAPVELVDTDAHLDFNPTDKMNVDMDASIRESLDTPPKRDAREHQPEGDEALEMGIKEEEKPRMARLRAMLASMSMGR